MTKGGGKQSMGGVSGGQQHRGAGMPPNPCSQACILPWMSGPKVIA